MFNSVLIANRGEIACRIIRTCKRLGVRSIAVYSEADRDALHVALADTAVAIGPSDAKLSYLSIDAIIRAAQQSRAEAVHPGYGFLSENFEFASALAASGITFIGPSPKVIQAMGDKLEAKALAQKSNVPLVPGIEARIKQGSITKATLAEIESFGKEHGFPLIIKAAGGGGGRGMRVVNSPNDLEEALSGASREALAFFNDERVFIEKCIEEARHIEVQIFGDKFGNVLALGDRDCSMQRKHQKVIEEAPAPNIPDACRAAIHKSATDLTKAAGYVGAGTVEFMLTRDGKFYFLEVNSRLQVEHPVTEEIFGRDLVELQLRIAAGAKLPELFSDSPKAAKLHAIECRLTAESPENGFIASTGLIHTFSFSAPPSSTVRLRVDSGFRPGDTVSHYYDSLLAKLIVVAPTRELAIMGMVETLQRGIVSGVNTNLTYLIKLLASREFGSVTHYTRLAEKLLPGTTELEFIDSMLLSLAALGPAIRQAQEGRDPWDRLSGFRLGGSASISISAAINSRKTKVRISLLGTSAKVEGLPFPMEFARLKLRQDGTMNGFCNGQEFNLGFISQGSTLWSFGSVGSFKIEPLVERLKRVTDGSSEHSGEIEMPFPGKILGVKVSVGAKVAEGESLVVIESMKMEHQLRAPLSGTVKSVGVKPGDVVEAKRIVVEIQPTIN